MNGNVASELYFVPYPLNHWNPNLVQNLDTCSLSLATPAVGGPPSIKSKIILNSSNRCEVESQKFSLVSARLKSRVN